MVVTGGSVMGGLVSTEYEELTVEYVESAALELLPHDARSAIPANANPLCHLFKFLCIFGQ
jgi:hypothetical protein